MHRTLTTILLLGAAPLCWAEAASASPQQPAVSARLVVGTKRAPPFAMLDDAGEWRGISIELWRDVAAELELDYELRELELQELIDGLIDGSLDVSVAALTVTAERETRMDFTHPFYTSGLGIAVAARQRSPWLTALERLFSLDFLKALASLALVLLVAGLLVWLFERRANAEQFGGPPGRGLGAGFWWSAVTMTTVGYGDKAPKTAGGRIVALIWMFASVIIISGFTAAIASTLTISQLDSPVEGPEDLPRVLVASVANSTSADYLRSRNIRFTELDSPRAAVGTLAAGEVDAVVYDAAILRYLAFNEVAGVRVLPGTFERQDYGIGLPPDSPLREPISRIVLRKLEEPEWQRLLERYLGR